MSVLYSTMEWRYGKNSARVIVSIGRCIGRSPRWHFPGFPGGSSKDNQRSERQKLVTWPKFRRAKHSWNAYDSYGGTFSKPLGLGDMIHTAKVPWGEETQHTLHVQFTRGKGTPKKQRTKRLSHWTILWVMYAVMKDIAGWFGLGLHWSESKSGLRSGWCYNGYRLSKCIRL